MPELVEISAPWCKNCTAMERTVFVDPRVKEAMKAFKFRKIMINDFDDLAKHPELDGLSIPGVPAFVVFGDAVK